MAMSPERFEEFEELEPSGKAGEFKMRTRRSWRNQDRLWRALGQQGGPGIAPPKPPARPSDADVPIAERWWLSPRTRRMQQRDADKEALRKAVAEKLSAEKEID